MSAAISPFTSESSVVPLSATGSEMICPGNPSPTPSLAQILLKPSLAIKGPCVFNQATPERCWNWSDFEIRVEEVAVAKLLVIPVSCRWWDVIIQKSEPECREGGQSLCCPQRDSRVLLSEFTTLFSRTNHPVRLRATLWEWESRHSSTQKATLSTSSLGHVSFFRARGSGLKPAL